MCHPVITGERKTDIQASVQTPRREKRPPPANFWISECAAGAAIGLGRLPPTHRIHQSKLLWIGFGTVAVAMTVLVIVVL